MFRTVTALAAVALAALAPTAVTAQPKPTPRAKVNPPVLANPPAIKRNLRIQNGDMTINEAAKTVSVVVRNQSVLPAGQVVVRLGIADAVDGNLVFVDTTRTVSIASNGQATVTFTNVNVAQFRQQVLAQFPDRKGRTTLFLAAIADPNNAVAETNESDNSDDIFLK